MTIFRNLCYLGPILLSLNCDSVNQMAFLIVLSMKKDTTLNRRRILKQLLDKKGWTNYEEIQSFLNNEGFEGDVSRQSIHGDVQFFNSLGEDYVIEQGQITDFGQPLSRTHTERSAIRSDEKLAIARAACSILLASGRNQEYSSAGNLLNKERIARQIERCENRNNFLFPIPHQTPTLAIDAGTTPYQVIRLLHEKGDLFKGGQSIRDFISSLRIFTNFLPSLQLLHNSEEIDLFCIGGHVDRNTDVIGSFYARDCVEKWNIEFDFAFIGVTEIDLSTKRCNAINPHDIDIKNVLLSRSKIRCLLANASKLVEESSAKLIPFSSFSSNSIDILITDPSIPEGMRERIEAEGICVVSI